MKLAVAGTIFACVVLALAPVGSTTDDEVANATRTSNIAFKHDSAAINQALKRLNLTSLSSVNALVETGLSMESDMTLHKQLLASTSASTKSGRAGRLLLLRGLTALAASGEYILRYGRALGSNASLGVLQVESDGYRMKAREGKALARRGAALLGLSFG